MKTAMLRPDQTYTAEMVGRWEAYAAVRGAVRSPYGPGACRGRSGVTEECSGRRCGHHGAESAYVARATVRSSQNAITVTIRSRMHFFSRKK